MGNYRNFKMTTYFVASGTEHTTKEQLEKDLEWFSRYIGLDKVYLEAFRGGDFASEEKVLEVKEVFEKHGIEVQGGITTCIPTPFGEKAKQRLFSTFCYNDEKMLDTLTKASAMTGKLFDSFIIDDFFFTNCTCEACRKEHDAYNKKHGITDGSWQDYRTAKLFDVSKKYIIGPAKKANPDCKVIIKYPNWMESYQETGYDPLSQKDIFDGIYTGTETRDPRHQDQHLPRYLSFSLVRYMEEMAPGRNGGGWFDHYDCQITEYYLEQAYLTAFAKAKELMAFCFQSLTGTLCVPALGYAAEKLDMILDGLGEPVGVPCYIPNASQGEDNIYDYMGMNGFPIIPVPFFPEDAPKMMLTASSAYDRDILAKLKAYVAAGGKALVTNGFVKKMLGKGIEELTSIRDMGRRVRTNEFIHEPLDMPWGWTSTSSSCELEFPVLEFRNNSTWGAPCKALKDQESFTLLARDTYGDGSMTTFVMPDVYSTMAKLPVSVLSKLRSEFACDGIWLEGDAGVGMFLYDNHAVVLYNYVTSNASDTTVYLHVKGGSRLIPFEKSPYMKEILPLYVRNNDSVFAVRVKVGQPFACSVEYFTDFSARN